MERSKLFQLATILILLGISFQNLHATDGYFRHGYGIKYSAMGGAGSALSLSSIGAATNPASLSFLDSRFDVSLAGFMPSRQFTVSGNPSGFPGTFSLAPGTIESESNFFPMPTIGANYKFNETMAVGLAFIANGGMNTDYDTAVFGDPTSPGTGVNIEQMFLEATYSIQFVPNHSFGVSVVAGYQRFAAKGLLAFANFSQDPANLTGNSHSVSTGVGFRVGYQARISSIVSIGASYQTKISMSPFDRYAGLFAEKGDFDVPATWNAGLAVKATKQLTLAFDVQQILYSGVKSVSNVLDPMTLAPAFPDGNGWYTPNPNFAPLGSENGAGFGWTDVMAYKFGLMYEVNSDWVLMAGFEHNGNPISESELLFNILAPGVVQNHITLGVTRNLEGGKEINFGFTYALANTVEGPNRLEAPGQQTIELKMSQIQFEVGYAFGF